MKPVLILGASEKAIYDKAVSEAKRASLKLIVLTAKEYNKYSKHFCSGSLENLTLFYISECNLLSVDDSIKFFSLIEKSPHSFILSATQDCNWHLKKSCFVSQLSPIENPLNAQLKAIMTEPNRNKVFETIKDADIIFLFNILKFGAYQSTETLDALIKINRNLFKCSETYIAAMLSFAMPQKIINTYRSKTAENPLQRSIKAKLSIAYPKLGPVELADAFLIASNTRSTLGAELSDEEKAFLKIEDKPIVEEPVFAKAVNLEDYF